LLPSHLIEILKCSQDSFPRDLQVPITLSEADLYQLVNIVSLDIYIADNNLVYIVKVPLATRSVFHVCKVLPLQMKVKDAINKCAFVQPEKGYILLDTTKQFYARLQQNDLGTCKKISKNRLVCKQNYPLQVSHSTSDCQARLFHLIRTRPKNCTQRILDLRETLLTPLTDNSWIFVAPVTDHITSICPGQIPSEIEKKKHGGTSTFLSDCTGHGEKIMIRFITTHFVNGTKKGIIPPLRLKVVKHNSIELV
jgi:hypothetical protein